MYSSSPRDSAQFSLTQFGENSRKGKAGPGGMIVRRALHLSQKLLTDLGIATSTLDAQLLMGHVLNRSRIEVQLSGAQMLCDETAERFWKLIARRLCHEPLAYITEAKEFFGLDFFVSPDCLIPRPDTEIVVEQCLKLLSRNDRAVVFDLCTGSGAIAITLAHELPGLRVIATDISPAALEVAEKNANAHGMGERISFCRGDLFAPIAQGEQADLIVTNPPYIGSRAMSTLPRSVRDYEPNLALAAGDETGVNFYRRILAEAPNFLKAQGFLVMEIGFDQAEAVKALIGPDFRGVEIIKDLAAHDRVIVLQKA